ncbi:hypothetical protein Nmel_011737 [Mimus melanotis]
MKTIPACGSTGFIERINCASSHRDEYKRTGNSCGIGVGNSRGVGAGNSRGVGIPAGCAPQLPLGRAGGAAVLALRGLGSGRGGGGGGAGGAAAARAGPAGAGEGPQTDRVHLARGSRGLGAGNSARPERPEEKQPLPCCPDLESCWDLPWESIQGIPWSGMWNKSWSLLPE